MSKSADEWIMLACVIILIVIFFAVCSQRDELKVEAVKRGFAEWVVDTEGKTTWKWKEDAK